MPYEWQDTTTDGAVAEVHLWPYRSLPKKGFVTFFAITFALVSVPLLAMVGSLILWGLLPFFAVTLGGLWMALGRSYRDGTVLEELRLWPDRITLTRHNPRGARQDWEANPHWTRLTLHETAGPVPAYLTLKGVGREVELGAFLSEDERRDLCRDMLGRLADLRP